MSPPLSPGRVGPLGPPARSFANPAIALFIAALWPLFPDTAFAHTGELAPTTLRTWSWEPGVILALALSAFLYARGLGRLRRATHSPRKLRREARLFFAGWLVLVVALVSPLHPWGRELFSAHMTQHELLMVAAAPLLVLGRPGLVFLCAFSKHAARELTRWNRALGGEWLWRQLTVPFIAWTLHTLALWIWHVPALFDATLTSDAAHAAQHASFLFSALLFWQSVFHVARRRLGHGLAVAYLFATILQSGALGALITFSRGLWYPAYAATTAAWGFTPLEDQQLGGLIMWVPAGLVYVIVALSLFAEWIRASDRPTDAGAAGASRTQPKPAQ